MHCNRLRKTHSMKKQNEKNRLFFCWILYYFSILKAWFHEGEILREKFCLRNTDDCTWVILLNWKRNFFSRNLICPYCACINSIRANFFRISLKKNSCGIKPLCSPGMDHKTIIKLEGMVFVKFNANFPWGSPELLTYINDCKTQFLLIIFELLNY